MTIGMGVGVLVAGRLLRPGREKLAFVATALGGAVFIALINESAQWGRAVLGDGAWALA